MATMIELAEAFFVSCDTGGGWEKCKTFCTSDASFACQNTALSDITTLRVHSESDRQRPMGRLRMID